MLYKPYKLLTLLMLLLPVSVYAQKIKIPELKPVDRAHEGVREDRAIIYGNFLRPPHSDDYQYVFLMDTNTHNVYSLPVVNRSTKKFNPFVYYVQPGTYALVGYKYSAATNFYFYTGGGIILDAVVGGTVAALTALQTKDTAASQSLQVFKNTSNKGVQKAMAKGQFRLDTACYIFTVDSSTLNYMGTWDFKTQKVAFVNEKEYLDHKLKKALLKYDKLHFDKANTILPR